MWCSLSVWTSFQMGYSDISYWSNQFVSWISIKFETHKKQTFHTWLFNGRKSLYLLFNHCKWAEITWIRWRHSTKKLSQTCTNIHWRSTHRCFVLCSMPSDWKAICSAWKKKSRLKRKENSAESQATIELDILRVRCDFLQRKRLFLFLRQQRKGQLE